jgi:cobalamin transport system substrate-binding protein
MNVTQKKVVCAVMCVVLLATLEAGCTQLSSNQTTQSGGIKVTDDAGRTVTIAQTPNRIVSLAPSITEDLYALGLGDKVVGTTTYCNYPPAANNTTKVGGFGTPNMEKIVSLKPDIVFTGSINNETVISALDSYGIPTVVIEPKTLTGILGDLSLIGKITDTTGNSSALVANLTQRLANSNATGNATGNATQTRVLYLVWYDPITSAGADTFEGDIIVRSGGINVAKLANVGGYGTISKESIVALNPSVIIANSAMNSTVIEQVKSDPALTTVDAIKNGKVFVLNSDVISRPGPRAFDAMDQIIEMIRQASQ